MGCSTSKGVTSNVSSFSTGRRGVGAERPRVDRGLSLYNADKFRAIGGHYRAHSEIVNELRRQGLEAAQAVVGFDFTSSNTWTGRGVWRSENLHADFVDQGGRVVPCPYLQVIRAVLPSILALDDNGRVPVVSCGDSSSKNTGVTLLNGGADCAGVAGVERAYHEFRTGILTGTSGIRMLGPTSFAPFFQHCVEYYRRSPQFTIGVYITDGGITEQRDLTATVNALVEAAKLPIVFVIVCVGEGSNPNDPADKWRLMKEFDDGLPDRGWDNLQFVDFHKCWEDCARCEVPNVVFALAALMEVPAQYKLSRQKRLGHFGGGSYATMGAASGTAIV